MGIPINHKSTPLPITTSITICLYNATPDDMFHGADLQRMQDEVVAKEAASAPISGRISNYEWPVTWLGRRSSWWGFLF
jgi:hypothetical protein